MTQRLVADAVFAVDGEDRVLAPGGIEVDQGRITWVGDPWQEPPERGTEVLEYFSGDDQIERLSEMGA